MEKFIRYFQGHLVIKVSGKCPERFITLCGIHNILLSNIKCYDCFYTMEISISGFFLLREICRKTCTRVTILEKNGFPFFLLKCKKRKIFILSILIFILYFCVFSQRLWAIDVEGTFEVSREVLLSYLEEEGIHY